MLKRFAMAGLLALTAVPASAQPAEPTAAEYAEALQGMVGERYVGGIFLAGIAAEGGTLVILVDGPRGWRDTFSPDQLSALFMTGFCEDAGFDFFGQGKTLRVDTLEAGADLRRGPRVDRCRRTASRPD